MSLHSVFSMKGVCWRWLCCETDRNCFEKRKGVSSWLESGMCLTYAEYCFDGSVLNFGVLRI